MPQQRNPATNDGKRGFFRFLLLIGALLLAGWGLRSCGGHTVHWKQEAKLHDGRVIVVDRVSRQSGKIFPENTVIEYEKKLAFSHPDSGARIEWTLPKGTGVYLLDFDSGTPYLVLSASSVGDYNTWGCPNPPWIVFRHERGDWVRIAFEQLPARFTTPNLLPAAKTAPQIVHEGWVTTVPQFESYLKKLDPHYRTIGREKISPIAKGCEGSVLFKQGRQSEIGTDNRR